MKLPEHMSTVKLIHVIRGECGGSRRIPLIASASEILAEAQAAADAAEDMRQFAVVLDVTPNDGMRRLAGSLDMDMLTEFSEMETTFHRKGFPLMIKSRCPQAALDFAQLLGNRDLPIILDIHNQVEADRIPRLIEEEFFNHPMIVNIPSYAETDIDLSACLMDFDEMVVTQAGQPNKAHFVNVLCGISYAKAVNDRIDIVGEAKADMSWEGIVAGVILRNDRIVGSNDFIKDQEVRDLCTLHQMPEPEDLDSDFDID